MMESYPTDFSAQYPSCEPLLDKGVMPQVETSFCSAIMAAVVAAVGDKGFESVAVFFGARSDDRVERGDEVVEGTAAVATAAAKETTVVSTERGRAGEPVAVPSAGVQVAKRCVDIKG